MSVFCPLMTQTNPNYLRAGDSTRVLNLKGDLDKRTVKPERGRGALGIGRRFAGQPGRLESCRIRIGLWDDSRPNA